MKLNYRLKSVLIYLLKISITAGLLIFLFKKADINKMLSIVKEMDVFYFLIAISMFVFTYYLGILRWQVLLRGAGVAVPFLRVTTSYLMGLAVNLFVPSTVGGDLARSFDLSVYSSSSKPKILATVILDRISGFVAIVAISLFSLFFGYKFINDIVVLISVGILFLILFIILLVLFNKSVLRLMIKVFNKIEIVRNELVRFHEAMGVFRSRDRFKTLMHALFLSFLIQYLAVLMFYYISKSLRFDIGMIYFLIFVPLIGAISMVPLTIGGLGLRDSSAVFFFTRVGLSASAAFTLSLLCFFLFMLAGVIGGIVYVFTLHPRRI